MSELGKMSRKCEMCQDYKMNSPFYMWVGILSKTELIICTKCAIREVVMRFDDWLTDYRRLMELEGRFKDEDDIKFKY
jgi:hypothetical protein